MLTGSNGNLSRGGPPQWESRGKGASEEDMQPAKHGGMVEHWCIDLGPLGSGNATALAPKLAASAHKLHFQGPWPVVGIKLSAWLALWRKGKNGEEFQARPEISQLGFLSLESETKITATISASQKDV